MEALLDKHIQITQGVRGGKPCLAGRRIAVADIAVMHLKLGMSLEEIAGTYALALSAVHAAMSYYHDHRQEIDKRIEADEAFAEAFKRNNPSLLQAKLQALKRG